MNNAKSNNLCLITGDLILTPRTTRNSHNPKTLIITLTIEVARTRAITNHTRTITNLETQTPTINTRTIETTTTIQTTTVTIMDNKIRTPFKTENPPTYGLHNIDLDNQNTAEQNFPTPAPNQPDT